MNTKNSIWTIRFAQISVVLMKLSALALLLLCGCTTIHSDDSIEPAPTNVNVASSNDEKWEVECVLTNAHVTIQIPRGAHVEQGRITEIGVYDMSPPGTKFISGAVYHDYKILCNITIETEQEFQNDAKYFQTDYFQEHTNLTIYDVPIGKGLSKDIQDSERHRVLSVRVNIERTNSFIGRETGTFDEDVEFAKKMVESIKLIKLQPDETDVLNPLSIVDVEQIKKEIFHLQPYMTPDDCAAALGISKKNVDTSVWERGNLIKFQGGIISEKDVPTLEPQENRRVFMKLREGHILILTCDNRGYVVSAQLDDKKWQLPNVAK
jgi:hypothetical protein